MSAGIGRLTCRRQEGGTTGLLPSSRVAAARRRGFQSSSTGVGEEFFVWTIKDVWFARKVDETFICIDSVKSVI